MIVFIKRMLAKFLFPGLYLYTGYLQKKYPIKFYSEEYTRKCIKNGGSIGRISDGEIYIALNKSRHRFQDHNERLASRIKEIMQLDMSKNPGFCVALNPLFTTYKGYNLHNVAHWVNFNSTKLHLVYKLVKPDQIYFDANAFRINGMKKENWNRIVARIKDIRDIWTGKKVLIVEADLKRQMELGESICLGVNSDFMSNAASVDRIIAPARNAFSVYDKLLEAICRNFNHDIVLLTIGMTSTVLAFDLYQKGIQAIDFGQTHRSYLNLIKKGYQVSDHIITPSQWEEQIIERVDA